MTTVSDVLVGTVTLNVANNALAGPPVVPVPELLPPSWSDAPSPDSRRRLTVVPAVAGGVPPAHKELKAELLTLHSRLPPTGEMTSESLPPVPVTVAVGEV